MSLSIFGLVWVEASVELIFILTAIIAYLVSLAGFLYWWRHGASTAIFVHSFKERRRRRLGLLASRDYLRFAVLTGFVFSLAAAVVAWMLMNRFVPELYSWLMVGGMAVVSLTLYWAREQMTALTGSASSGMLDLRGKSPIYFDQISSYRVVSLWGRSMLVCEVGGESVRRVRVPLWRCRDQHLFAGLVSYAVKQFSPDRRLTCLSASAASALEGEIISLQELFEVDLLDAGASR